LLDVSFRSALRRGRLLGGLLLLLLLLELLSRHLLLPVEHRLCERVHDEIARADRVVVAGDDVVGLVGIAVRVDEGNDRDPKPSRLAHR
jgi:hypothetical protein